MVEYQYICSMEIRLLTFDGCPSAKPAQELIEAVVTEFGIEARIIHIRATSQTDAEKYHFLGSPTIQVNGKDIERSRRSDKALFGCRIYTSNATQTGVPPREMLVQAISEADNN